VRRPKTACSPSRIKRSCKGDARLQPRIAFPSCTAPQSHTMQCKYYLADHAHVCCTGRFCVFLDINRDRYFSVPTNVYAAIEPAIAGCGVTKTRYSETAAPPPTDTAAQLIESLIAADVLRVDPDGTHLAKPPELALPTDDLRSLWGTGVHHPSGIRMGLRVWYALLQAHYYLRACSLRTTLTHVLKCASGPRLCSTHKQDVQRAMELTQSFGVFRPVFPRNYLCLFDSLALILYLARNGVRATWVFGVREDPFEAHCWVQAATVVLNEFADRVAFFTPIMAV